MESPSSPYFPKWNEQKFEEGYDSDGEILYPNEPVLEGFSYDDDQVLPSGELNEVSAISVSAESGTNVGSVSDTVNTTAGKDVADVSQLHIDDRTIDNMSVQGLRVELKSRNKWSKQVYAGSSRAWPNPWW